MVVRNGYHQERDVVTGAGAITVTAPRVNDKRVDPETTERQRFSSKILPGVVAEVAEGRGGAGALVEIGTAPFPRPPGVFPAVHHPGHHRVWCGLLFGFVVGVDGQVAVRAEVTGEEVPNPEPVVTALAFFRAWAVSRFLGRVTTKSSTRNHRVTAHGPHRTWSRLPATA